MFLLFSFSSLSIYETCHGSPSLSCFSLSLLQCDALETSNSTILLSNINPSLFPDQKWFVGRTAHVMAGAVREGQEHHPYHGRLSTLLLRLSTTCHRSPLLWVRMLSIYGAEGCAPQTTPFTNFPEATHASDCQSHTPTTRLPTIQASKPNEQWKPTCLHAQCASKSRGHATPNSFYRL